MVKVGLFEEVTFGQRPDQCEEVSHGDRYGRSISGGEPASAKAPKQGMWLEYSKNCDKDSIGNNEQGTKAGPHRISSSGYGKLQEGFEQRVILI